MAFINASLGFRRRYPVAVIDDGNGAARNVRVTIPTGFTEFWDHVDADGFRVRFTDATGVTILSHNRQTWAPSTNDGVFDLTGVPVPNAAGPCVLVWMYWDSDESLADPSIAVPTASQLTGHIELARPSAYIQLARPPAYGAAIPLAKYQKESVDEVHLWVDWQPDLELAARKYNGKPAWEEPFYAEVATYDTDGTPDSSFAAPAESRWVLYRPGGQRRDREALALRVTVKDGTNGAAIGVATRVVTCAPGVTLASDTYRKRTTKAAFLITDQLEA